MSSEKFVKDQIEKIKEELEENPDNPALLHDLGVGYHLLGEYDEAVKILRRAVRQSKSNSTYLFNLANAYSGLEEFSMAKKHYLDALQLNPGHIPSLTNLADCYEATGDVEKAHELFAYVTRIAPENALGYFNLGNFLLRQNKHIDAVKQYEHAIRLEESFTDAYYNIAWILTEVEAFEKALEYAEKGLSIEPDHQELQDIFLKIRSNLR